MPSFGSNYFRGRPFFAKIKPGQSATRRSRPAFLSASARCAPGRISRASSRASVALAFRLRRSAEISCFTTTSQFGVSPGIAEIGQRELSAFVGIIGDLSEAASFKISSYPGSDGFDFKLIRKCDQPSLDFNVTAQKC
jgi:hypothetical protein